MPRGYDTLGAGQESNDNNQVTPPRKQFRQWREDDKLPDEEVQRHGGEGAFRVT